MARKPLPVARSKISIGSVTADYTEVALAADTYVPITGVRSVPGFGDSYQDITVEEVGDGRTRHAKGTASGQTMEIVCSRISDDPGQIAMKEAADSLESFNLKMEIPDGAGALDTFFFSVLVMTKPTGMGGPNDTQTITFSCQPQEAPIEAAAV